jgi:hypothetical protein
VSLRSLLQEHYDDHCVLVLQLAGRKRWRVRSAEAAGVQLPQVRFLGDAKRSLGDAKSSLGDAKSSLDDAKSSPGDAKSSPGDVYAALRATGAAAGGDRRSRWV